MNSITIHGSLTVNGRIVIVHMDDNEAFATGDGARFNVRSMWQLYQLLRLLVWRSFSGAALPIGRRVRTLKPISEYFTLTRDRLGAASPDECAIGSHFDLTCSGFEGLQTPFRVTWGISEATPGVSDLERRRSYSGHPQSDAPRNLDRYPQPLESTTPNAKPVAHENGRTLTANTIAAGHTIRPITRQNTRRRTPGTPECTPPRQNPRSSLMRHGTRNAAAAKPASCVDDTGAAGTATNARATVSWYRCSSSRAACCRRR